MSNSSLASDFEHLFNIPTWLDETWKNRSACRDRNDGIHLSYNLKDIAKAKQVCNLCPVKTECLKYAEVMKPQIGTWGGLYWNEIETDTDRRETHLRGYTESFMDLWNKYPETELGNKSRRSHAFKVWSNMSDTQRKHAHRTVDDMDVAPCHLESWLKRIVKGKA